jgi:hypothetical protein
MNKKWTKRKKDETFNASGPNLTQLKSIWSDARFCIVEECSMLSCDWNGRLAAKIEAAKESDSKEPFGGVHMIYCG